MQEVETTKTIPEMVDDVCAGKMDRRHFIKKLTLMGVSGVGIGAIVGTTVRRYLDAQQTSVVNPSGDTHDHLQLHDQHLTHQSQGNIDHLHNDYAAHAVVEDSMHPLPFVGPQAIMARKGVGMAALADWQINLTNRLVHGNQVTAEWVATGTHTGDFPGLPATGRPFSIQGVTVVVRQEGKIVRESIYYDMDEVRRQLGPQ